METILILSGIAVAAGLVTAVLIFSDRQPKQKTYEIDSALLYQKMMKAMKGE